MSADDEAEPGFVLVPPRALSPETLQSLIEEFVTREGTDYGAREYSLDEKVAHVKSQLERGEVVIAFDLKLASATLLPRART